MKMRVLLITLTVLSFGALATLAYDVRWHDVNSGMEEGKRNHKYILADVYTSWCGWCKKLDRDTFSDQGLVDFLGQKFVCVKANAEDHGAGQNLARQYSVDGFPCPLVFDSNGKLIGRIVGYKDASGYQSALTDIISSH
jgi:thioredoxin-related protein